MAEHAILKLDPDTHLLLEQPLLRLPLELLKRNFKSTQRSIEPVNKHTTAAIQTSASQSPAQTLASLDATLQKAQNLKRKLEALHAEEQVLHSQQKARITHLQTLHEIPSLADVAYDRWSHVRLDRLLVDYLLRQGFTQSAKELAEENKLGDLVDVGVFEEAGRIEQALRRGEVKEALSWCAENKNALKKTNVGTVAYTNLWRCADGYVTERAGTGIASTAVD
jgi:macrophage erythroblast attacher